MGARYGMTMRATIRRNTTSTTDPDGNPKEPNWVTQPNAIPCFLWSEAERTQVGTTNAVVEDLRLLVPVAADINPATDQILAIKDRRAQVIDAHVMRIVADQRVQGSHRELLLEAVA